MHMMPLPSQSQQRSYPSASPSAVSDRIAMSYQDTACDLPNIPQTIKSQSIPISGMHRTASEVQLCEDEALADYRDFVVYSRIVNGISRRQETSHDLYLRQENEKCLAHLMSTRNQDPCLQSLSRHIVQSMSSAQQSDDYFCGEEPLESSPYPSPQEVEEDILEEDEEGIFALEL